MALKFCNILILIIILLLFSHTKRLINKQKKIINIAFPVNNKYVNLIYIALVSLLENSDNNTIYNIYVQRGELFKKSNSKLLRNLEKIYFNCIINIINMKSDFSEALEGKLETSTYYRLKLPILCPKLNRIIHIDADTLILKDLMELYTLNFERKYILGRLDILVDELDYLGIHTDTYINCGILLIDLYSLRKYKYVEKFLEYIFYHNDYRYLNHHDQTLINYVCHDKIGILRPKFHMWPFKNKKEVISTNKVFRIPYNEDEFIKDYYDPFIIHYPGYGKKNIKDRGGIYYEKYFKYYIIAEERKKNTKFGFFKMFSTYFLHYYHKIKLRYKKKK